MARKLQIKRGSKANLPALDKGELGLALDTNELFVGGDTANQQIAMKTAVDSTISNLQTQLSGKAPASHTHTASQLTDTMPIAKGGTGATTAAAALTNLGLTASGAELNYNKGVTGPVQTQLNGKQATVTGGASSITANNLAANMALVSDAAGKVQASAVTGAELGYLDGVTGNVQTQINGRAPTVHSHSGLASAAVPLNADLNSYTTPGQYHCGANATAASLKNCPTQNAFSLEVILHAGTLQRLTEYITASPKLYFRNQYDSVWGPWQREYSTADKPTAADVGAAPGSHTHTVAQVTGVMTLAQGGTGANTAAAALTNLGLTATAAELNYSDGVTSSIQTQINQLQTTVNGKQPTVTGAATTITGSNLTASRAVISGASGKVEASAVTSTELEYLDGVTSGIQSQLNGKASTATATGSSNGLLAAADKSKLDGIAAGAQVNAVTSVSGKTGAVTLVKGDVGLGSVDNTADANKTVYSANRLGGKLPGGSGATKNVVPVISPDGVMEVNKYIDFHDTNSTEDFDVRLYQNENTLGIQTKGGGMFDLKTIVAGNQAFVANANQVTSMWCPINPPFRVLDSVIAVINSNHPEYYNRPLTVGGVNLNGFNVLACMDRTLEVPVRWIAIGEY